NRYENCGNEWPAERRPDADRELFAAHREPVARFQLVARDKDAVEARAVRGPRVDNPPGAARIEQRFGVVTARRGGLVIRKDEVVVAATADPHAWAGADELAAALRTGDRSQPQDRHLRLANRVLHRRPAGE